MKAIARRPPEPDEGPYQECADRKVISTVVTANT